TSTQWISLSQTDPEKMADRKTHKTEGDQILEHLAEETGGRAFYPYHVDDLDQSFQDIGDELRNQYSIAYNPTNYVLDGRYHKIRIEIPDHKGYQVRARRGYFANASTNTTAPASPSGAIIKSFYEKGPSLVSRQILLYTFPSPHYSLPRIPSLSSR